MASKYAPKATPVAAQDIQKTFASSSIDLIAKPLGSRIVACSDEFFAAADNLTTPTPPIRKAGTYTHAGAWFDGWETRRHNPAPFDWVVIRLGVASGRVTGVEIDTAFFDGNHAPAIAVEGCFVPNVEDESRLVDAGFAGWEPVLDRRACGPSRRQAWRLDRATETAYSHVRLLMFPDGGIARFRLFGHVVPVFPTDADAVFDLAAAANGGVAVACSDQHFGSMANLLLPGRGVDMRDGWETKRSRGEHVDWVVVRLGCAGSVRRIVVDTAHFRGNFPTEVQVFGFEAEEGGGGRGAPGHDDGGWVELLAPQRMGPDVEHVFDGGVLKGGEGKVYGYVKMVMIPDGGVKRIRVFGSRRAGG